MKRGPEVLVVGAGLAGLAAGLELDRDDRSFEVWEAGERAGGVVATLEADGFRFETGPNTVPASAAELTRVVEELGLSDRLVRSSEAARERYLFHSGRLVALPTKPPAILATPLLTVGGRLRLLREPLSRFRPPAENAPEPTVHELFTERFGEQVATRFAGAFVRGVYAGDARRLGARSAFPRMWSVLCEHGSLIRGLAKQARGAAATGGALVSFEGGFGALTEAMARRLGASLRCGFETVGLEPTEAGLLVRSALGAEASARRVVLALPARSAADLITPHAPGAGAELRGIEHKSVHVVHLGFASREALGLPRGFGFLVPPNAGRGAPRVLGVIVASDLFADRAPAGGAALSMIYAAETLASCETEDERVALALDDLRRAGARHVRPEVVRESIWPGTLPQYHVGHTERIRRARAELSERLPGVELAGSPYDGVGVDDVLRSGRLAAAAQR